MCLTGTHADKLSQVDLPFLCMCSIVDEKTHGTHNRHFVLFLYWLAVLDPGHGILTNFRHYQLAFEDLTSRPLHTLHVIWLSAPLQVYTSFRLLNVLTCVPDSLIGLFQKNFNGFLVCPGTESLTCLVGEERWARSSQTSLSLLPSASLRLLLNLVISYGD